MQIRRAVPADGAAIARAEAEIFSDPWSERDIVDTISTSGAMCFVATGDEGELLSYLVGRQIPPEGEIYRIATLPEARRRAIAYRLLDYAVKTERGRGLESLFLEVRQNNIPARTFYRAYGFKEIGIRKNYYKNPSDDAIIMLYSQEI